jgi:hypothetical protein
MMQSYSTVNIESAYKPLTLAHPTLATVVHLIQISLIMTTIVCTMSDFMVACMLWSYAINQALFKQHESGGS